MRVEPRLKSMLVEENPEFSKYVLRLVCSSWFPSLSTSSFLKKGISQSFVYKMSKYITCRAID